jgi:hypothetical protein
MTRLRTQCRFAVLLLAIGLPSCAATDPLTRVGLWQPNGANEQNLRIMVVDQHDLLYGRGDPGSDGAEATAAIQRLRTGKLKVFTAPITQTEVSGTQ